MARDTKASKCLVTGAAGFIGSHLAKRLLDEGKQVVLVDDFSRGNIQNLLDLGVRNDCIDIDLRNYEQLHEMIQGIDTVFHMAARVGSLDYLHGSIMAEILTLQTNLEIDANVFKICLENNVNRIVYASSISVYPMDTQSYSGAIFSEDRITSPSISSPKGVHAIPFHWCTLTCPEVDPPPSLAYAPIARIVPSSLSDTEYPL